MNTPTQVNPQEQIIAAVSVFIFFFPLLISKKTEFIAVYMRQGFLFFTIAIVLGLFSWILPVFSIVFTYMHFGNFLAALYLAYKAYTGERHAAPQIYEISVKLIQALKLENLFSPNK